MSVDIGFETIGNATLTVFDGGRPVLTTDPWLTGSPYFGSWGHAYAIPEPQKQNVLSAKYVWISHGHPDHLDEASLRDLRDNTLLIPDHAGNRIYDGMVENGYSTQRVKSNEWVQLSKNVKVKSFADWNQDAALLVSIMDQDLIFDLNDGSARGWRNTIKKELEPFRNKFLLKLCNWGDADMINFCDLEGNFIQPMLETNRPLGRKYSDNMKVWGCNFTLPFSSLHRYQRMDSNHVNRFITPLKGHYENFDSSEGELLPAFIVWDSEQENFRELAPNKLAETQFTPEAFGDSWSDDLDKLDCDLIDEYFGNIEHLRTFLGRIHIVCGNVEHTVSISDKAPEIIFRVPRNSLITAMQNAIFDDLLIGNFMKTSLIGIKGLYPDFTPYVAKYSDNGLASTSGQLRSYFGYYRDLSGIDFVRDRLMFAGLSFFTKHVAPDTKLWELAKLVKKVARIPL